ncbi:MAG TPA: T9SS type A sorting domain-containing protein, partial [Ohtaekwangia sp.]|nr:T9SS type A sorting domain-containing protein [Ohtaekwangia sp.]
VSQPLSPLTASLYATPVCFGKDNGSISVTATGGTFPYQYAINNGQTFQAENVFVLGAGEYAIVTRDDKGCIAQKTATVIQRNDQPLPNFLAASNRNALDTLILTEISIPKPDSIHWVFDENAIVINNDEWNPTLKFQEEGVYTVTMTGFFAGCDYSVAKSLYVNPYDPSIEKEKDPEFKPIQEVIVSPNPSPGAFDVTVRMNSTYNVSIKVYDVLGAIHYAKEWIAVKEAADHVTMERASSGVYVLRVVTERDAHDVRIIINK